MSYSFTSGEAVPSSAAMMNGFLFPPFWETPELTQANRLPARAFAYPYADAAAALARDPAGSPWVRSLDGEWTFHYLGSPYEVTPEHIGAAEMRGGGAIRVPGNWTMQGWDRPHYTNRIMPFENDPPYAPEANPTGVYRRRFTVPEDWSGRRTRLRVNGAESLALVYVDGAFAGMSSDSRLPAEFDITPWVEAGGEHTLAIVVIRYSAFSYVEDQDHWWMAGLHRSVELLSTADAWIEDVFAKTGYRPEDGTGTMDLRLHAGFAGAPGRRVAFRLRLLAPDGTDVWKRSKILRVDGTGYREDGFSVRRRFRVRDAAPWSAEDPALYTLLVSMVGSDGGGEIEHTALRVGFRSVRVAGGQLLFNGQPVILKGVNRHDHDPDTGKTVSRGRMVQDLELLKRHNFNAVRTAHYPNDPLWLDLCDEYGIYVIDEANQEAHANYSTLGHDPRWERAFVERAERMVLRDRNHACVFAWSLGNETGYGRNHDAAARAVRAADDSRLLLNEPAVRYGWEQRGNTFTPGGELSNDITAPMYPELRDIVAFGENPTDKRPMIPCEYSHAMGNSNGCLKEFWDAVYRYPVIQGGFIWDWVEQGLRARAPDGREYWAYGGDFGDEPNDVNFNCNGLVMPDREPKPAMEECRKLFQPLHFSAAEGGGVRVRNRDFFRRADWLELFWTAEVGGAVVAQGGPLPLRVAPGAEETFALDLPTTGDLPPGEAFLRLSARTRETGRWHPAGFEVAWEQFPLDNPSPATARLLAADGGGGEAAEEWLRAHGSLFTDMPRLHVLRGFTDNDGVKGKPEHWEHAGKLLGKCRAAGLMDLRVTAVDERAAGEGRAIVRETCYATPAHPHAFLHRERLSCHGDGWLRVENTFVVDPAIDDLPRLGVRAALPMAFDKVEWFGRGPVETYADRKAGGWIGRFRCTVGEAFFPYIVPQETGNREDLRWIAVRDNDGTGLLVTAEGAFSGSVLPYTSEELIAAAHPHELPPRTRTHLNIDLCQRGLGTASCGPDTLPEYKIPPGTREFIYWLRILRPGEDPGVLPCPEPLPGTSGHGA